jgi:hypothetical protein
MMNKPTPEEVHTVRLAWGKTLKECADRFGYALKSWQQKENTKSAKGYRSLTQGEYELLLLFADLHPDYKLVKK